MVHHVQSAISQLAIFVNLEKCMPGLMDDLDDRQHIHLYVFAEDLTGLYSPSMSFYSFFSQIYKFITKCTYLFVLYIAIHQRIYECILVCLFCRHHSWLLGR